MNDCSASCKMLQRRIEEALEAEGRRVSDLVQQLTAAIEQS
jgi:hypothetical protein